MSSSGQIRVNITFWPTGFLRMVPRQLPGDCPRPRQPYVWAALTGLCSCHLHRVGIHVMPEHTTEESYHASAGKQFPSSSTSYSSLRGQKRSKRWRYAVVTMSLNPKPGAFRSYSLPPSTIGQHALKGLCWSLV